MKKIDKIKTVKVVAGIVVSIGVGAIVGNAIKATTPANVSTIKKVCISVGAFVLSGIITDKAVSYTETKITEAIESVKKMVHEETQPES